MLQHYRVSIESKEDNRKGQVGIDTTYALNIGVLDLSSDVISKFFQFLLLFWHYDIIIKGLGEVGEMGDFGGNAHYKKKNLVVVDLSNDVINKFIQFLLRFWHYDISVAVIEVLEVVGEMGDFRRYAPCSERNLVGRPIQ